MKTYPSNSPEAMARIVAMTMITDARLDDRELDIMERLHFYQLLGLGKRAFSQVVQDYCADLLAAGTPDGRIDLMDQASIDAIVDAVDDPAKRAVMANMLLNIVKADGFFHDAELALFRYVLERWDISFDEIRRAAGAA